VWRLLTLRCFAILSPASGNHALLSYPQQAGIMLCKPYPQQAGIIRSLVGGLASADEQEVEAEELAEQQHLRTTAVLRGTVPLWDKGTANCSKGTDNRSKGTAKNSKGTDNRSKGTAKSSNGTDDRNKGTDNRPRR
jgi:hypothetical protein